MDNFIRVRRADSEFFDTGVSAEELININSIHSLRRSCDGKGCVIDVGNVCFGIANQYSEVVELIHSNTPRCQYCRSTDGIRTVCPDCECKM